MSAVLQFNKKLPERKLSVFDWAIGLPKKPKVNEFEENSYFKPIQNRFIDFSDLVSDLQIPVKLEDHTIDRLPTILHDIVTEINVSKYMLDLEENFDDEGSSPYSKETWIKAVSFLIRYSKEIYNRTARVITPPKIFHGPDASIDILWKNDNFSLIINVTEGSEIATFYGNAEGQEVEGAFSLYNFNFHLLPSLLIL